MRKLQQVGKTVLICVLLCSCTACGAPALKESEIIAVTMPLVLPATTETPIANAVPAPASTATHAPETPPSSGPTAGSTKTPVPTGTPSPTWPMKTFKYKPDGYVTANAVNMRVGPGTEYQVLRKAGYHAAVTMIAESGDWYYVLLDGMEGFISKEFVHVGPLPTPESPPKYSDDDIYMAAQMIWLEAKGGTYEEFQAIATVLANRIASSRYPSTVEDNIFAPGQFTVADDKEWFLSKEPDSTAMRAADSMLNGGERVLESSVMYFRAKRLGTEWRNRKYIKTIGNHCFFS